ncbi:sensor domain-containing diguanylate cyclase [Anaerosalibacter sp. Marseille-P3206]|uniref:sensor domain-containing diguanylate cyclase n=1 Tax=Anaerosalibacter sp. Marseille-P3206 TaxID=1871005 RepID=UPI000984B7D4|nr:sensor domain-containing diguanylate cyclase [Anaerosalibacter sp. Marseille-P3206]
MDKLVFDILNYVNEGIVILNENSEILFWNNYMEYITDTKANEVINSKIFDAIPGLNKVYFKKAFNSAMEKDFKFFFSSEMHKNLISNDFELNFRINKFKSSNSQYLIIEFMDVTSQFIRIEQLKEYANELYLLNKKLKQKEKEIERLAYYDTLTNLANRTLFYNLAEKLLANAKRRNTILGLMFIDIDKFKYINDTYGHRIGDKILIEVAKILKKCTRENDVVARLGGDEFLVLLPDLRDYSNYRTIAKRIANANSKVKVDDDIELNIALSIGVSFYPQDGNTIDDLISKSDKAMYNVKNIGGNKCVHYING